MQIQNFSKIISPWNDTVTRLDYKAGCIIKDAKLESNGIHYIEFQELFWGLKIWKPAIADPSATSPSKTWVFNIHNTYTGTVHYSTTIEEITVADLNTFIHYALPVVSEVIEKAKLKSALGWATKNITQYIVSDPFAEDDTIQRIKFIKDIRNKFGMRLKEAKQVADEAWDEYRRKNP